MGGTSCSLNSCRELAGSTTRHSWLSGWHWTYTPTHIHTHTHPVILGHGNATVSSRCVYSVWFPIWMCPSHGTVNGFPFPRAGQRDQTLSRSCHGGRRYQEEWGKSRTLRLPQGLLPPFFLSRNWKGLEKYELRAWAFVGEGFVACCWRYCVHSYIISMSLLSLADYWKWYICLWNAWILDNSAFTIKQKLKTSYLICSHIRFCSHLMKICRMILVSGFTS